MASGGASENLVLIIEEQIRTAFETRGSRLFVPEQFAELGDEAQVVDALVKLASDGKRLVGQAVYRCPEGHDYGSPLSLAEVDASRAPPCPVCTFPEMDEDPRVMLRFVITDEWADAISKKKGSATLPHW
jgi:hypothetical protein